MIAALLLQLAVARPESVNVTTPRGITAVPISASRGTAAFAVAQLVEPLGLGLTADSGGAEATVTLGGATFRFQLGGPFVRSGAVVCGLLSVPYRARDTLFVPLEWLADCVPRLLAGRYRWDARRVQLDELPLPGAVAAAPIPPPVSTPRAASAGSPNPITGLRLHHRVVIDPGHGGADPGNPGRYFPGHLVEKDITLAIARLLRAELLRRGIASTATRLGDTLIALADRGAFCRADCDLFVSIHVNAMPRGRASERVSGAETYFLSDAKTEDAKRVATMENDAIRFEAAPPPGSKADVSFILRDLQQNEYLRESARLAELVETRIGAAHPGGERGVQQAGFMVLALARRPAILVEAGFATNPTDGAFLSSSLGQHKIASAIADAIVAYLLEFERKLAVATPGEGR